MEGGQLIEVIGFGREINMCIIGIAVKRHVLEAAEQMPWRKHVQ